MVVGWACLGGWVRERILMNTCLSFDECENGSSIVCFKGISEKRTRILKGDITESERRRIALRGYSGYCRYIWRKSGDEERLG